MTPETTTPSDLDISAQSILERLHIDSWEDASICVLHGEHTKMPGREFDVVGYAICEDCIRDIAPVVTAIAAALEAEG